MTTSMFEFDLKIGPTNRNSDYAKPITVRGTSYGDAARRGAEAMGWRPGDWKSWTVAAREVPYDTAKLLDQIAAAEQALAEAKSATEQADARAQLAEWDAQAARAEVERLLAAQTSVAADTVHMVMQRLDSDDPSISEQLVQFEDEWRKESPIPTPALAAPPEDLALVLIRHRPSDETSRRHGLFRCSCGEQLAESWPVDWWHVFSAHLAHVATTAQVRSVEPR